MYLHAPTKDATTVTELLQSNYQVPEEYNLWSLYSAASS